METETEEYGIHHYAPHQLDCTHLLKKSSTNVIFNISIHDALALVAKNYKSIILNDAYLPDSIIKRTTLKCTFLKSMWEAMTINLLL